MTREQAIKWLKTFRGRYGMNELEDAVDVAIKALEKLHKIRAEIEQLKTYEEVSDEQ